MTDASIVSPMWYSAMRRKRITTPVLIKDEIAQLRGLDLRMLRLRWQFLFRKPAPAHLPRHLLLAMAAYRIQAERFGDLDRTTGQVLADANACDSNRAVIEQLLALDNRQTELAPGTVLVREWNRSSHRVMVMDDGFAWNGESYDSLSAVAFAITGTRWNGPRFFGLRDKAASTGPDRRAPAQ